MALASSTRCALMAGLAAALALGGCQKPAAIAPGPSHDDLAVATVAGRTVWASEVRQEAIAQGAIGRMDKLDTASPLFRQTLDEVIDQRLLAIEATRQGLDKDPQVQRAMAAARDRALGDALVGRVVADAASEPAIRGVYDQQRKIAPAGQAPQSLDAARPQIVRFLTYDQIRDLLEKLRSRETVQLLIKTPGAPAAPAQAPGAAPPSNAQGAHP